MMKELKEMEITLIPREKKKKKEPIKPQIAPLDILLRAAGLLIARAAPLPGVAPFGLAFLAMERKFSVQSLVSLAMVAIGYLTLGNWHMVRYIGACLAFEAFLFILDRKEELSLKSAALTAATVTVLFDIGSMLWTGFSLGGVLLTLIDLGLVSLGILVFDKCRSLLSGRNIITRIPGTEEKLSLCIMAGIALLSFQSITIIPHFAVVNVLGLLLLGMIAVSGGVLTGTVAGLAIGFLLGIGGDLFSCLAIFGVCGLTCGLCARFGKYGAAVGLTLAGMLLSAYGLGSGESAVRFYEVPAAAALLAVMPAGVFQAIRRFTDFDAMAVEANNPYKEHVQTKLALAAASFQTLSDTFVQLSDKQNQVDMQDIAALFDTAADRVCRTCTRVGECWHRDFNATYKTMFKFLEIMERKGVLNEADVDPYFAGHCLRLEGLVKEVNRLFEIYKINQVWKSKLCENRELVGEQFSGVAQILEKISSELDREAAFDNLAAEEIRCRLEAKEIQVRSVQVVQALEGKRAVQVCIRKNGPEVNEAAIPPVLKSVLGASFTPSHLPVADGRNGVTLQFHESPDLRIAAGFACTGKSDECGDAHMVNVLRGGKFIATLSDGMGTGHRASRESNAIVGLLEDFMDAGFDKTVAVKLINSIMVMKSANEAFATVDMCMIDLYTGEAEFIKNGAEPSYIKRKDGTETIRAASLPVGVISGVEIETFAHKLGCGDTVVMVSDGLEIRDGHEGWIRQTIDRAAPDIPVQELADQIMEKSVTLKGGEADDDMTVIVLRTSA